MADEIVEKCLKQLGGLISSEEYMAAHGQVCPRCKDQDCLTAEGREGDDLTENGETQIRYMEAALGGARKIYCDSCGYAFNDVYKLVGYEEIED
jgi:hypothetical protein